MGKVSERVELGASTSELWQFVTDPDNFARYVEGYASGRALSAESRGPGARYAWTAGLGPLKLRAEEHVVRWMEPDRVDYEGELAGVSFHSSMELAEKDDRTELEVSIDYDPPLGALGKIADPLLARFVERDVKRSLERLRRRFPPNGAAEADVIELYRRRAKSYDVLTELYRLMGFPLARYRRMAADALELREGSTVVEIGCGTGKNFPNLVERVGPKGRVIGVDLTDAMLDQARRRVERSGWQNVELVRSDAAHYDFPENVDGILSTLALPLSPHYDEIVARGAKALGPKGRWVLLDMKLPRSWPKWMVDTALVLTRPYGVDLELADRHGWESLERHLPHTRVRELFFGGAYLAVGWNGD